jgi:hypothetical protein
MAERGPRPDPERWHEQQRARARAYRAAVRELIAEHPEHYRELLAKCKAEERDDDDGEPGLFE